MGLLTLLGGPAILLWAAIKFGFSNPGDPFLFGLILAFFFLGGGWMTLDALRARLLISEEGITSLSPFRKPRSMTWQQIERVSFNYFFFWLVLHSAGQRPIRVSQYIVGFYELIQALRDNLPPSVTAPLGFRRGRRDAA